MKEGYVFVNVFIQEIIDLILCYKCMDDFKKFNCYYL